MTYARSQLCCPCCGMELCKEEAVALGLGKIGVRLWCGFGICASEAANAGAGGATELDAFKVLDTYVRWERSQREEE